MGDEGLCFEVVLEGDGFYMFLDAAGDLALVAPRVKILQITSY